MKAAGAPIIALAAQNVYRLSIGHLSLSETAVCFPTDRTTWTSIVAPPAM
jgi:hypothetical protein